MALLATILAICLLAFTVRITYIAFLKPGVSSIPGPFLSKFTDLWRLWQGFQGRHSVWLQAVHRKYGTTVRIGPNAISVSDPAAIPLVYDSRPELLKSSQVTGFNQVANGKVVQSMVGSTQKQVHASIRKPVASLYSMSNILSFEPRVDEIIHLLIGRFEEEFIRKDKTCNIAAWASYCE